MHALDTLQTSTIWLVIAANVQITSAKFCMHHCTLYQKHFLLLVTIYPQLDAYALLQSGSGNVSSGMRLSSAAQQM